MTARGDSPLLALEAMRSRVGRYPGLALEALALIVQPDASGQPGFKAPVLHELSLGQLSVGMVLAEDLRTEDDILLAPRGYEVSIGLVERAANLPEISRRQTVRVLVAGAADEDVASRRAAVVGNAPG